MVGPKFSVQSVFFMFKSFLLDASGEHELWTKLWKLYVNEVLFQVSLRPGPRGLTLKREKKRSSKTQPRTTISNSHANTFGTVCFEGSRAHLKTVRIREFTFCSARLDMKSWHGPFPHDLSPEFERPMTQITSDSKLGAESGFMWAVGPSRRGELSLSKGYVLKH